MRLPWQKHKETEVLRTEFTNPSEDSNHFSFQPSADDEEEGQVEDQGGEQEPTLDDLDDDTRSRVEAFYSRQQEAQRARLQEQGLDLAQDGQIVVRDPQVFSAWAAPVASPGRGQPASPAPSPPPQASAAPEEDLPPVDFMALSGAEQEKAIERIVARATAPLVQQNQELRGQIQRRSARDALAGVRAALDQHAPEIAGIVDHPNFAAAYQRQAATMDPVALEDPQLQAALAGACLAYLRNSPTTPPGWTAAPRQPTQQREERPRDEAGRFLEVASNLNNQRNVGQVPQGRGGMAPPRAGDALSRDTGRFLEAFREHAPGRVSRKAITSREIDILTSPTQSEFGDYVNYSEWKAAMDADKANRGGRR